MQRRRRIPRWLKFALAFVLIVVAIGAWHDGEAAATCRAGASTIPWLDGRRGAGPATGSG